MSSNGAPPPLPTRKPKKHINHNHHTGRHEEKAEKYENMKFNPNAKDASEKFQRMQNANDKFKKQNEELEKAKKELQSLFNEATITSGSLENSCQELNLRLESERQRWQYKSQAADIEVQNLKKQYIELEKETRKYQDALGKAKNFHFGDDHISNTVELAKTISDIVVLLEEITTVKGKDVSLDEKAANELLFNYKCTTKVMGGKGKPVLSAALQRLILEEIFRSIDEYLFQYKYENQQETYLVSQLSDQPSEYSQQPLQLQQQPQPLQLQQQQSQPQPLQLQQQQPQLPPSPLQAQQVDQQDSVQKARAAISVGRQSMSARPFSPPLPPIPQQELHQEQIIEIDDNNLEAEITTSMKELCNLVQQLSESREGTDDITKVTPINIRQQVYEVLGIRGFGIDKHPFIDQLTNKILEIIGKYRQLKSKEKQEESQEKAAKISKQIVLLYFRLLAQEPVPEFTEFFEAGTPLQTNIMEGTWDDHEIHDLEVEICSFPFISVKSKDDRKVLNKGIVLVRKKNMD